MKLCASSNTQLPKLLKIAMNITNDIRREFGLYKCKSIQIGKRPFIVMDVFTECTRKLLKVEWKGKIYKYLGSLQ